MFRITIYDQSIPDSSCLSCWHEDKAKTTVHTKMEFARVREFLLGAYNDLPNILVTGSLLIGALTGYLPLLWLSLGLIALDLPVTYLLQLLMNRFFPGNTYLSVSSTRCGAIPFIPTGGDPVPVIDFMAPTYWMSATIFFAVFTGYNAIQILFKASAKGATQQQINMRRAYCFAVLLIAVIFGAIAGSRILSGCETLAGGALGALVGGGLAIGYWHLLDVCGSGLVPDILQIVANSAPGTSGPITPVICAKPATYANVF